MILGPTQKHKNTKNKNTKNKKNRGQVLHYHIPSPPLLAIFTASDCTTHGAVNADIQLYPSLVLGSTSLTPTASEIRPAQISVVGKPPPTEDEGGKRQGRNPYFVSNSRRYSLPLSHFHHGVLDEFWGHHT